jgi:hypothetical protein
MLFGVLWILLSNPRGKEPGEYPLSLPLASRGPCVGVRAYLKPGVAVGVTQRVALSVARTPFRTVLEG